jgi:hypothetical protein
MGENADEPRSHLLPLSHGGGPWPWMDGPFRISYQSPGSPNVARRAGELLNQAGIAAAFDPERGYDHGTY